MTDPLREGLETVFARQREAARRGAPNAAGRKASLEKLDRALRTRSAEVVEALAEDLGRPAAETWLIELFPLMAELRHALRNLNRWMHPETLASGLAYPFSRAEVRREPKGVVLIIGPWNYPFQLAVGPLIAALAAGNRAVVKPSELAPATSSLVRRLLADLFDETEVAVAEGDASTAKNLLSLPFDHIFFTGGTAVGSEVMAAAARTPASVTLELGGKSPAIVDATANFAEAARKIAWGKFLNCGQTCVAPDYVLVPRAREEELLARLADETTRLFGGGDYGRIVNGRHFDRIASALAEALAGGARLVAGGKSDPVSRRITPTIVADPPPNCRLAREEIFGPVLPVFGFDTVSGARDAVLRLPPPLVLYVFARQRSAAESWLQGLPSGDAVVNDVVVQFGNPNLPFGGRRQSGIGKAHGEAGFRAFSHERTVLRQPRRTPIDLLRPPYTPRVTALARLAARYLAGR